MASIIGACETEFGRLEGETTLSMMEQASFGAMKDAGLDRKDIDGVLTGYSLSMPRHWFVPTSFCEYMGIHPNYCHMVETGGSTGVAMIALAKLLCDQGKCRNVLVACAENRKTGLSTNETVQSMADCGHLEYEAPFGPSIPGFYGLVASRYMHEYGLKEEDLAEFAVLQRQHASNHPKAHYRERITIEDVMKSRPVAKPLKLLDCCPISDGGCAIIVSADSQGKRAVKIAGTGQSHPYQFVIGAENFISFKTSFAVNTALQEAGVTINDIQIAGVYDSFSITLLIFLEEMGLAPRGKAAQMAREGYFSSTGLVPVNTHGGLMSFGHSGVAGGMAHIAEVYYQLAGKAGDRQIQGREVGIVQGEGGVISSQYTAVLIKE